MRLPGVQDNEGGPLVRFAYWMTRRRLRRVPGPIRLHAYHPRLLRAMAAMELGQEAAHGVPAALKTLAQVKVAMLVGCPF